MRAVEAMIKVSSDGSAIIHTGNLLKPGQHKVLIIADEAAITKEALQVKKKKKLSGLKLIHLQHWPRHSTFRREEIYNDHHPIENQGWL